MKRKKMTMPPKTHYDLSCGCCGQTNVFDVLTMCATAFCPQCQTNTYHNMSNTRFVKIDDTLQLEPAPVLKERLYSPDGGKKMGFAKGNK